MATARVLSTKDAIDIWDFGPNICRLPTLMVASSYFPHFGGKMTHKWGRMATYPKLGDSQLSLQEERSHGETPHSMRVYVPSPKSPLPLVKWRTQPPGRNQGEKGFVAILGKTAKIHPKVVPRNSRISVSQEKGASGFCMDANRSFASLLQQRLRFKA